MSRARPPRASAPPTCWSAARTCSTRATGIDAPHDVLVRDGEIAEIGEPGALEAPDGAEVIDGEGRHLFPGFVDPHVHLRTPGPGAQGGPRLRHARRRRRRLRRRRRDAEHDPTVDSAPVLRSLREAARREARIPVGFLASITRGLAGRGADRDGRAAPTPARSASPTTASPSHRAGILRKALQYQKLAGGILAPARGGPDALRQGRHARGRGVARGSASRASRASPSRR